MNCARKLAFVIMSCCPVTSLQQWVKVLMGNGVFLDSEKQIVLSAPLKRGIVCFYWAL